MSLLLRKILFVLPLHRRFIDLIFPVVFTGIGAILTLYLTNDLKLTTLLSILLLFIVLWYQNLLYRIFYTYSLDTFFLAVRQTHPVTQKFAANLLIQFLMDREFSKISRSLFCLGGPRNLQSLVQMLETNGVSLAPEMYTVLLTKAGELFPTNLVATWDTIAIPLGIDPYRDYFTILRRIYSYLPIRKKIRIFIFENLPDFQSKTVNNSVWQEVLSYHKDVFNFDRVYYAFRDQFNGIRGGTPEADRNIDDFVSFQTQILLIKHRWVIGKERKRYGIKDKTFVIADPRVVIGTEKFVAELIKELDRVKQVIYL